MTGAVPNAYRFSPTWRRWLDRRLEASCIHESDLVICNTERLRDFFEVDAKHIVLATLGALAREKKIGSDAVKRAIQELSINPEKANPAVT